MLHPLREFLDGISFVPFFGTSNAKENGWEEINSPLETIYHKELDYWHF